MPSYSDSPWPAPTPAPLPTRPEPLRLQRRRPLERRQKDVEVPVNCDDVGNDILSCAPTTGQIVVQNTTMHFVWNKNQPSFAQFNLVDVYLFHEDTLTQAANKTHLPNQTGRVAFDVNDQWWGSRGDLWDGKNISYPMYFLIVASDHALTGAEPPQATFTAIQTRVPDSVLAAEIASSAAAASTSAAILSSVAASLSSASLAGSTSSAKPNAGSSGLQSGGDNDNFPKWALAVIIILGVLAFLAFLLSFYFLSQYVKVRRQRKPRPDSSDSSAPIMAARQDSQREPLVTSHAEPISPAHESSQGHGSFLPPPVINPNKPRSVTGSTTTRETGADPHGNPESAHLMASYRDLHPLVHSTLDGSSSTSVPFSGADAEIMAAAFREKLRKPDFTDRPIEEGESPESQEKDPVLERALAEEGRGLRSVSASKVRVHGDESEVGTVREHRRSNSDLPSVDSG